MKLLSHHCNCAKAQTEVEVTLFVSTQTVTGNKMGWETAEAFMARWRNRNRVCVNYSYKLLYFNISTKFRRYVTIWFTQSSAAKPHDFDFHLKNVDEDTVETVLQGSSLRCVVVIIVFWGANCWALQLSHGAATSLMLSLSRPSGVAPAVH